MPRKTLRVETAAEAYLGILRERGIEYFFANPGTDFASIFEAFAKFAAEGTTAPTPMIVPHEFVALSMAHGYYEMTGRPQVVMVHTTVGTANAVGALINAARTQVPVLFSAGRNPVTEDNGLRGMRDTAIHWAQEAFDQGGMVREWVKWDYELRQPAQLEHVVDRALELAMTDPKGPVYLVLPREVLAHPLAEVSIESPSRRQTVSRRFPDPERIAQAAEALAGARAPVVVTSAVGRVPAAVDGLVELAEAGGIGVVEVTGTHMNFPGDHPCHLGFSFYSDTHPAVMDADVILVVDADVPWIPAHGKPRDDAKIIHLGVDPFFSRYPIRSYACDVPIVAEPVVALPALARAVRAAAPRDVVAARRATLKAAHDAARAEWRRTVEAQSSRTPIGFEWASHCLGDIVGPETIVVNEYDLDVRYAPRRAPGSYFASPWAGGLGWGFGAALGAKLAAPQRTVVAALGDGCYIFGVPTACHHVARKHDLPVLAVIFNNSSWDAVKSAALRVHPRGWVASTDSARLSGLDPSPRYEEIAGAFDAHGERVEKPDALPGALRRALHAVQSERRQALVNVVCRR